jgi:hypothetical protein
MRCKNNAITYNFDFAILTLLGTEITEIRHDAVAIYILAMDPTKVVSNDLLFLQLSVTLF